jgi:hypothetical protein
MILSHIGARLSSPCEFRSKNLNPVREKGFFQYCPSKKQAIVAFMISLMGEFIKEIIAIRPSLIKTV